MTNFTSLLVDGIPLVLVIFGLIEFRPSRHPAGIGHIEPVRARCIKSLGLCKAPWKGKGNWLTVTCLLLGLGFGIAYRFTILRPLTFADWFSSIVFGLALGLVASGFYKFANTRFPKVQP